MRGRADPFEDVCTRAAVAGHVRCDAKFPEADCLSREPNLLLARHEREVREQPRRLWGFGGLQRSHSAGQPVRHERASRSCVGHKDAVVVTSRLGGRDQVHRRQKQRPAAVQRRGLAAGGTTLWRHKSTISLGRQYVSYWSKSASEAAFPSGPVDAMCCASRQAKTQGNGSRLCSGLKRAQPESARRDNGNTVGSFTAQFLRNTNPYTAQRAVKSTAPSRPVEALRVC